MEIEQPQLRTVDGRQEIYDNILQDWRGVTQLDRIKPVVDKKRPFVCPNCTEDVDVLRYTKGWDLHQVDPETGEMMDLIEDEITDADIDEYRCSEGCGWTGNYKWFREMENGDEEEKPIQIALDIETLQEGIPETPKVPDPDGAFFRYVWRNATPDPF